MTIGVALHKKELCNLRLSITLHIIIAALAVLIAIATILLTSMGIWPTNNQDRVSIGLVATIAALLDAVVAMYFYIILYKRRADSMVSICVRHKFNVRTPFIESYFTIAGSATQSVTTLLQ